MNSYALLPVDVARLARHVCELDVRAFKPGNVNLESPGHGMTAADFTRSADAAAVPLSLPGLGVGERILFAVRSTRATVNCNTNLGIVLLLAPLAQAALMQSSQNDLRARVHQVLATLTVDDAALAYRAIRVAAPAGLGASKHHDVNEDPQVTLLQAMREAQARDSIAYQYAADYQDIFAVGAPLAKSLHARWKSEEWAMVGIYLRFLATVPDTHVERKFGAAVAERVRRQAAKLEAPFGQSDTPEDWRGRLRAFDRELKQSGINPGTSADLSVASLMAWRLQEAFEERVSNRLAKSATGFHPQRGSIRAFLPTIVEEN
jgi:triphosphoribosyl-dephospho-CoA synthase